jgi:hypothetical protein
MKRDVTGQAKQRKRTNNKYIAQMFFPLHEYFCYCGYVSLRFIGLSWSLNELKRGIPTAVWIVFWRFASAVGGDPPTAGRRATAASLIGQ